jgi:putative N6-adenine-specific DNA methylase
MARQAPCNLFVSEFLLGIHHHGLYIAFQNRRVKMKKQLDNPSNSEKRIKRHVLGKIRAFFVSTAPDLEHLCLEEVSALGPAMADAAPTQGGVDFQGHVHDCYLANLKLRMANRILLRIETFRATNFRQLEKKLVDLPWELYLDYGSVCDIHVTSRRSRLFHANAIAERFEQSLVRRRSVANRAFFKNDEDLSRFPQQIFVRVLNDRFSVSIDSSGALLHKRGLKTRGGRAPIRETIAAAILTMAAFRDDEPLVDPLCGAGTFSLEGAMMANHIPAGWYRGFAFMGWPCFRPSRWKHIRREAKKEMVHRNQPIVCASDKDKHACQSLEKTVGDNDFAGTISVTAKDFFDLLPSHIQEQTQTKRKGLVVINPPYGRRLETKAQSQALFIEICKKLKQDFKGWKFALIAPDKRLSKDIPFPATTHRIFHGGLKPILLTGRIC